MRTLGIVLVTVLTLAPLAAAHGDAFAPAPAPAIQPGPIGIPRGIPDVPCDIDPDNLADHLDPSNPICVVKPGACGPDPLPCPPTIPDVRCAYGTNLQCVYRAPQYVMSKVPDVPVPEPTALLDEVEEKADEVMALLP